MYVAQSSIILRPCLPATPHGSVTGKRKPGGVCLRRAFRDDDVSFTSLADSCGPYFSSVIRLVSVYPLPLA